MRNYLIIMVKQGREWQKSAKNSTWVQKMLCTWCALPAKQNEVGKGIDSCKRCNQSKTGQKLTNTQSSCSKPQSRQCEKQQLRWQLENQQENKTNRKGIRGGPEGTPVAAGCRGGLRICCHTHAHGGCLIAHFLFASNGSRHEVGIRAKGSRVMSAHKGNTLSSSSWLPPAAQSR